MSFYNPGAGGCGTAGATQSIAAMPTTYAQHPQAAYNQAAPTYPYAQAPTYSGQPTTYGAAATHGAGAHAAAYQYGSSAGVAPGSAYDPYAGSHAMPSTMGNAAALAPYGGATGWQPQTQYQDPAPMTSMMMQQTNAGVQHWGGQQAAGAMSATASLPTQQTVPTAQQPAQLQVQDTYSKGFIDGVAAVARSQYNWNQAQHGEVPQAAMFPTGACGMPPAGGYYSSTTPPGACGGPPGGCGGMPPGGCGMPPAQAGGPYPAPLGPCGGTAPGGPVPPGAQAATSPQSLQKPQAPRQNAGKYKATGNKRRTCC